MFYFYIKIWDPRCFSLDLSKAGHSRRKCWDEFISFSSRQLTQLRYSILLHESLSDSVQLELLQTLKGGPCWEEEFPKFFGIYLGAERPCIYYGYKEIVLAAYTVYMVFKGIWDEKLVIQRIYKNLSLLKEEQKPLGFWNFMKELQIDFT